MNYAYSLDYGAGKIILFYYGKTQLNTTKQRKMETSQET